MAQKKLISFEEYKLQNSDKDLKNYQPGCIVAKDFLKDIRKELKLKQEMTLQFMTVKDYVNKL